MATVQTDGSSAVTPNSTVNNGGTAINVGTSSVLDTRNLGTSYVGVFGSTPIENATRDYADPALSAGVFKNDNHKPIAKRLTSVLAGGISNDALLSGAGVPENIRGIHRQEKVRTTRLTTAIRAGYWNEATATWTTAPTTAVDNFWDIANDTTSATSTDQAATPTRDIPGELTYKLGSPMPVSVDYNAKTG